MKKFFMTIGTIGIAALCSANASKETAFARMDVDKDGIVTLKEYVDFFSAGFIRMDKNKDDFLDKTEFAHPAFKHMDTNADGKIDKAEDKAYRERTFKQHDVDADGFLSKEEFLREVPTGEKTTGLKS